MNRSIFRYIAIALVIGALLAASGCAGLKKKFTRKKAPEKKTSPVYYHVREYDIQPSLALYEKHYIFWLNWHRKLVSELGNSHKNDIRSAQELLSNLEDMGSLLVDEKAAELDSHIEEARKAKIMIDSMALGKATETRIRRIFEREYRSIKSRFSPADVSDFIRKEWRTEVPSE